MRNLKRALSLALASVMLLGMMVVGTSAAFTDSDQIVNTEAVEITAGLGLFAGNPDGSFNPKGTVTRAQMATVIAKMLYGSDVDADAYKGSGKFSDVANFEGGWAEGYVNICAGNNIISGYPDGTFKPGQAVTTAEASVMIIKALKVEVPAGTWPTNVMVKADEMELFDELAVKPGANVALNRDQLASIVWEGMNYSADGVLGYEVNYNNTTKEFKTWSEALEYYKVVSGWTSGAINPDVITEVKGDTLAKSVFNMTEVKGVYVTGNQATGLEYTELSNGAQLNLETGLDMLGHYVNAYFDTQWRSEKDPGVAYAIVDQAEYYVVEETIAQTSKKDYLAVFGAKTDMVNNPVTFNAQGLMLESGENGYAAPTYSKDNFVADAGTYVVDTESGKIIAFIADIAVSLDQVTRVSNIAGKETIRVGNSVYQNNEDSDVVFEYDGIAEDDIVIVKQYKASALSGNDSVVYLEKPEVISGKITKTGTISGDAATYIDGKAYINSAINPGNLLSTSYTPSDVNTYDAYIYDGKLVGVKQTAGSADLGEVIYVVHNYTTTADGAYGSNGTDYYYAQGIDANGKEVSVLIGVEGCSEKNQDGSLKNQPVQSLTTGKFYTFKESTDREQAKKDVMVATEAKALTGNDAFDADVDEFFAGNATIANNEIKKDDKYLTVDNTRVYLTADTKFVVFEKYAQNADADELEIVVYTGAISKALAANDTVTVAGVQNDNGNKLASIVMIGTASVGLKSEDYIYVVDGNDNSPVVGGVEYTVYFTATNEFKPIVADTTYSTGFYGDYTIDEDGVYDLGARANTAYELMGEEFEGVFGTSIITVSETLDLEEAGNAVIVDVRTEETLEDTEVAKIESLKDIESAKNADYRVFFNVLREDGTGTDKVVTHIFVTSVKKVKLGQDNLPLAGYDQQGNPIEANWEEA